MSADKAVASEAQPVRKPRSRLVRGVYLVLGFGCLGLAYMSWLPGIPTFDFVMLAAFFFARSSDRFHAWLVSHPVFGRIIRGYRTDGFSVQTKAFVSFAVIASLTLSATVLIDSVALRWVLAGVGVLALAFIWSRPTKQIDPSQ